MRLLIFVLIIAIPALAQFPPSQTMNIGNITGSVSLPNDAASESTQQQVLSALSAFSPGGVGTVKIQDGVGNPITSQANGAQQALDVGVNVGGVQIDPRNRNWSLLNSGDSVTAFQNGVWDFNLTQLGGASLTLGQKDYTASIPVTAPSVNYSHISGTLSTNAIKSGAGVLNSVCLNTSPAPTVVTIYDSLTATGTVIASVSSNTGMFPSCVQYNLNFSTGLSVLTDGSASIDITVTYQ